MKYEVTMERTDGDEIIRFIKVIEMKRNNNIKENKNEDEH